MTTDIGELAVLGLAELRTNKRAAGRPKDLAIGHTTDRQTGEVQSFGRDDEVRPYSDCVSRSRCQHGRASATWEPFKKSQNDYDWLGSGIYFWEYGADRAMQFAHDQKARGKLETPAIVGALIQLGRCFDLMGVAAALGRSGPRGVVAATPGGARRVRRCRWRR